MGQTEAFSFFSSFPSHAIFFGRPVCVGGGAKVRKRKVEKRKERKKESPYRGKERESVFKKFNYKGKC